MTTTAVALEVIPVCSAFSPLTNCIDVLVCDVGCQGSTAPLAFDYLISAGGMSIEWAYPYVDYWYSREPAVHKCSYYNDAALADGSVGAVLDGYVVVEVLTLLWFVCVCVALLIARPLL
jgi:hypothetical protein